MLQLFFGTFLPVLPLFFIHSYQCSSCSSLLFYQCCSCSSLHFYRCYSCSLPEIVDLVFAKTSPLRSFCLTENKRFGLVFVKTGSINSGTSVHFDEYCNCSFYLSTCAAAVLLYQCCSCFSLHFYQRCSCSFIHF